MDITRIDLFARSPSPSARSSASSEPSTASGLIGTEVQNSSGGRLSANATLIAPAGPAFSIWSVIYIGLAAFAIWQWTPAPRPARETRGRRLARRGVHAAQRRLAAGHPTRVAAASVAVIVALLAVLLVLNRRLAARSPASTVEKIVVDGTFGLYLGWVSVATFANIAAVVTDNTAAPPSGLAQAAAAATLLIVSVVGVLLTRLLGGKRSGCRRHGVGTWLDLDRTDHGRTPITGDSHRGHRRRRHRRRSHRLVAYPPGADGASPQRRTGSIAGIHRLS